MVVVDDSASVALAFELCFRPYCCLSCSTNVPGRASCCDERLWLRSDDLVKLPLVEPAMLYLLSFAALSFARLSVRAECRVLCCDSLTVDGDAFDRVLLLRLCYRVLPPLLD